MWVECKACRAAGDAALPEDFGRAGFLACPACGEPVTTIDVRDFDGQTPLPLHRRPDRCAELAAMLFICPSRTEQYFERLKRSTGLLRVLPPDLTGRDRAVRVVHLDRVREDDLIFWSEPDRDVALLLHAGSRFTWIGWCRSDTLQSQIGIRTASQLSRNRQCLPPPPPRHRPPHRWSADRDGGFSCALCGRDATDRTLGEPCPGNARIRPRERMTVKC